PLTYLYGSAEEMYFVFRAMYARLWVKLTAISSRYSSYVIFACRGVHQVLVSLLFDRPGTLLDLLKLFESLICTVHPALMLHLQSIDYPPVKTASRWIQVAFVGVLEVEQILL